MTTADAHAPPHMTADEFLAWDGNGRQGKLELVNGEVVAMSPASATHGLIQAKLARMIGNHLEASKSHCRVGTEMPLQPRIGARHNVRVPDLAVTYHPPSGREQFFPDPVLIVEILSPSNEEQTWQAIWACVTIQSISEILVVDSERVYAEVFTEDANGDWPSEPVVVEAGGAVKLASIGAAFAIDDIYAKTHLLGAQT